MTTPPESPVSHAQKGSFGPNAWLVDDMYDRFLQDPTAVSASWREFFADYQRSPVPTVANAHVSAPAPLAKPVEVNTAAVALRGAAARIVTNMEASLSVPTATSVRTVAARLLEINRASLNESLARTTGAKVSFTHLIAFAIIKGIGAIPSMNATFVDSIDAKGTPGIIRHEHVGLGLAVDVLRPDGTRNLLVPVIRDADTVDFRDFLLSYEEIVRKVHNATFGADDFVGATCSLTNPGTLGTVQSVPRLMPGQGAIFGVGALAWPAGFEAADPTALADLGVGPAAVRHQRRPERRPQRNFHAVADLGRPQFRQRRHAGAQMGNRFGQRKALQRDFTGAQPKRRRDTVLLRRAIVKREQFGRGIAGFGPALFQQMGNVAMQLLAPALQKRIVGGVLNQRIGRIRVMRVERKS